MAYVPNLSVRRAYWASQETVSLFVPTSTNSAGSFDIATLGELVCGGRTKTATLLWSTTDLFSATFIGQPFIYSFRQEGSNCGIMSQRAFVILDTGAFWMGVNQKFFLFDGFVKTIPCDVNDYVFGSFNTAQAALVWCFANTQFNEVTWFYPSAVATACDRYVTYNYVEQHWTFGTLGRSCGVSYWPGVTTGPVLIDASGNIYTHETGTSHGSDTPYLESGPIEMGNGDRVMRIQRIVPDDDTAGDVDAKLYTSFYPDQSETLNGPYTLASPTSVRLTARQVRLRLEEAVANAWRVGVVRLGIVLGGRR